MRIELMSVSCAGSSDVGSATSPRTNVPPFLPWADEPVQLANTSTATAASAQSIRNIR